MIPLVKLGPHGQMGPHVLVIEVWGTMLEVNFHLLHVHASVGAPPRPIPTFQEPLGIPTPTYFSQLVLALVSLSYPSVTISYLTVSQASATNACIMHGYMGRSAFPTYLTLNCTTLTSCYFLLELLVIRELSILDSDIDWETLSQRFSQIQSYPLGGFEFITHAFKFYLCKLQCNTRYYYDEYTVNS